MAKERRRTPPKKPFRPVLPDDHSLRLQAINRRSALVEARVEGVAKGHSLGLFIHGDGGLGKTFTVTQTLKRLGVPVSTREWPRNPTRPVRPILPVPRRDPCDG